MLHYMNVDIETYSSVDITKAGAYAYAESPDFEILLIAYKLDDGSVKVIDQTGATETDGDFEEFWNHLPSVDVIKTAYNAN